MANKRKKYEDDGLISMSLGDHLEELRSRLMKAITGFTIALLLALIFGKWFLAAILSPYQTAMQKAGFDVSLLAIDVTEPFMVYIRASLVLAGLISSPWLFYQMWAFISAGLYKHERRFVYAAAPASTFLFICGVLLFLLGIAPLAFTFLAKFQLGVEYSYQPRISNAVNFIFTLSLVFGAAFQMPIAVVFAERMGLVKVETLCRVRKYVILAAFIVAAMATPPDPVTQVSLAIPLYILYEGSILVCRLWHKKRKQAAKTTV